MNNEIKNIKLEDASINKRVNVRGEDYFVIVDNSNNQVYFCFQNKLSQQWEDLVENYQQVNKIEFAYENSKKGNKVCNIVDYWVIEY